MMQAVEYQEIRHNLTDNKMVSMSAWTFGMESLQIKMLPLHPQALFFSPSNF